MAISFSTLSGTPTRSGFETELAKARTWLNGGILVGDIDAASIDRVSLYRPDTFGFPKQNTETNTQQVWARPRALDSSVAPGSVFYKRPAGASGSATGTGFGGYHIREVRGRQSIFLQHMQASKVWPIASLACRFRVYDEPLHPNNPVVEWSCNIEARAFSAPKIVDPDFEDSAGTFRIVYKAVGSAAAPTAVSGTKRNINSAWLEKYNYYGWSNDFTSFNMGGQTTLAPGIYDTWVEYDGSGVTSDDIGDTYQIIIGASSMLVETHRA